MYHRLTMAKFLSQKYAQVQKTPQSFCIYCICSTHIRQISKVNSNGLYNAFWFTWIFLCVWQQTQPKGTLQVYKLVNRYGPEQMNQVVWKRPWSRNFLKSLKVVSWLWFPPFKKRAPVCCSKSPWVRLPPVQSEVLNIQTEFNFISQLFGHRHTAVGKHTHTQIHTLQKHTSNERHTQNRDIPVQISTHSGVSV